MKVAIIGAGAAGLVTGREFRDAGYEVQIFEQGERPGGIWAYQPEVEDDLLGINPQRPVYSSIYDNLRTNLPSDLMAFIDYPFDARGGGQDDWPRFPRHSCVLEYLNHFVRDFELQPLIRYSAKVESVLPENESRWRIEGSGFEAESFDVVAVCNGHFSKPRVIAIQGADQFAGLKLHSHNYRNPEIFKGQRVAVLGTGASGADIVREIATQAREVLWCGHPATWNHDRFRCLPFPDRMTEGEVHFENSAESVPVDMIVYCSGYEYDIPFLNETLVQIIDNYVFPLYQRIVPPQWPSLGFIGLPFLVVPFPLYAMQARWFVRAIGGQVALPNSSDMQVQSLADEKALLAEGVKQRHLHRLGDRQQRYYNLLAKQCGEPELADSFTKVLQAAQQARQRNPAGFRDEPLPKQEAYRP